MSNAEPGRAATAAFPGSQPENPWVRIHADSDCPDQSEPTSLTN